jgi:vacuolar-type H+-ATPase subunit E/Vma4
MDVETLAKDLLDAIRPEIDRAHKSAVAEINRLKDAQERTRKALAWMEERAQNSTSFGSHCHAYEVAARHLKLALDGDDIPGAGQ